MFQNLFFVVVVSMLSLTYSAYVPANFNQAVQTFLTKRVNIDRGLRDWMIQNGHNQSQYPFPQPFQVNVTDLPGARFNLTSNLTSAVFHIYHPDHLVNYTSIENDTSTGGEVLQIMFNQPAVSPYVTGLHETVGYLQESNVVSNGGWKLTYPIYRATVYVPFHIDNNGYLACNETNKGPSIGYDETFVFEDDALISPENPFYSDVISGYKTEERTVEEIIAGTSSANMMKFYSPTILMIVILFGKLMH
ncbi:uncharacterized protein LOC110850212 isoform X2 [Folsomia candida]|uniref:uncharacterized protein LOC110850212 isoform X2 n=1 Tax=Folsomia candida TaxID=158441 RepID=UPI001605583F|nr:uncharacterized protein LOC110850212 isoform X2 [Folsomia candida]